MIEVLWNPLLQIDGLGQRVEGIAVYQQPLALRLFVGCNEFELGMYLKGRNLTPVQPVGLYTARLLDDHRYTLRQ